MAAHTLSDLYVEELRDLYNAERQILKALPKIIKAASNDDLKEALESHRQETEGHVTRLEQIFENLGKNAKGKTCHGMEGVLSEGAELIEEDPEPEVLDAGIISAAQRVEHYEIAAYGSVRTWAEQLGLNDQVELLEQTLEEEKAADEKLTELATQSINAKAAEETEVERRRTSDADRTERRPSSTRRPASEKRPRPTA
ncbi:MAG TPA: ferritin-like domain-containing protein [Gemmatimonadaceae bacterium]|nr:ferritin-like domain-containing protein [Gemmatimonadaceae bacterium]